MTKRLDSQAGEQDYNSIIASVNPTARVSAIEFTPGTTADVPAGTVLVKTGVLVTPAASESGTPTITKAAESYAPITKALTGNDLIVVLADDVEKGSAKVSARVYVAGNFVREKLHTGGTYALTADDYAFMRQAGIYSESAID